MAARGGRATKFDYLLENHLLTQKELGKALIDARQRKETVENILIKDYKIPKSELGESLRDTIKCLLSPLTTRIRFQVIC